MTVKSKFEILRELLGPEVASLLSLDKLARVANSYLEVNRYYHNIDHPIALLRLLIFSRQPSFTVYQILALKLMVLYHDVWYKVGREPGESEHESARWMADDLKEVADSGMINLVRSGILATINHQVHGDADPRSRPIIELFLDLDLVELGQQPRLFADDNEAIWLENQPCYTRAEFERDRAAWSRNFLRRDRIFQTKSFAIFEEQARENLGALARNDD